jgi:hypothetical protein
MPHLELIFPHSESGVGRNPGVCPPTALAYSDLTRRPVAQADHPSLKPRPVRSPRSEPLPHRLPRKHIGSRDAQFFALRACFYWWAHQGSNLGPAD